MAPYSMAFKNNKEAANDKTNNNGRTPRKSNSNKQVSSSRRPPPTKVKKTTSNNTSSTMNNSSRQMSNSSWQMNNSSSRKINNNGSSRHMNGSNRHMNGSSRQMSANGSSRRMNNNGSSRHMNGSSRQMNNNGSSRQMNVNASGHNKGLSTFDLDGPWQRMKDEWCDPDSWFGVDDCGRLLDVPQSFGGSQTLFKWIITLWLLASMCYLWSTNELQNAWFLGQLDHWALFLSVLYCVCSLINGIFHPPQPCRAPDGVVTYIKVYWILFEVAAHLELLTSVLYWLIAVHKEPFEVQYDTFVLHGLVCIVVWLDGMVLNRIPVRIKHYAFVWTVDFIYVLWTIIHAAAKADNGEVVEVEGDENPDDSSAIYIVLDWRGETVQTVFLSIAILTVIAPLLYLFQYLMSLYSFPWTWDGSKSRKIIDVGGINNNNNRRGAARRRQNQNQYDEENPAPKRSSSRSSLDSGPSRSASRGRGMQSGSNRNMGGTTPTSTPSNSSSNSNGGARNDINKSPPTSVNVSIPRRSRSSNELKRASSTGSRDKLSRDVSALTIDAALLPTTRPSRKGKKPSSFSPIREDNNNNRSNPSSTAAQQGSALPQHKRKKSRTISGAAAALIKKGSGNRDGNNSPDKRGGRPAMKRDLSHMDIL